MIVPTGLGARVVLGFEAHDGAQLLTVCASVCEHVFVRWQQLDADTERERLLPGFSDPATVRTFDAPEALDTRFYEVRAKSALNRVPESSRVPFRFTVNPYRGCTHACTYCFARPTHTYLDFDARRDFEREIIVKINAPELLRAELSKATWNHEHVALGTNTDPYQWAEGRYRLMPGIWEALRDTDTPCSVLTKSPLLLRDISLLRELSERVGLTACLSVPTIDEKAWRQTEPRTPNPRARLEAVGELNRAGIPTGVLIAPLMPGVNDDPRQVAEIVELAQQYEATTIGQVTLHLRGEVRQIFFDWLRAYRPDLISTYEEIYRGRAYAPAQVRRRMQELVRPDSRRSRHSANHRRSEAAAQGHATEAGRRTRPDSQQALF